MEACCKTNAAPHVCEEFFDDPTLADCCRRDLREQAHNERLVNRLKECDISEARQRVEAAVIGRHPEDIPEHGSEVDSLATDSDDEGEHLSDLTRLICSFGETCCILPEKYDALQGFSMQDKGGCMSCKSKPGFEQQNGTRDWGRYKISQLMPCRQAPLCMLFLGARHLTGIACGNMFLYIRRTSLAMLLGQ